MKKTLLFILITLSIVVLILRFSPKLGQLIFNIKPKSGLTVISLPTGAKVFLDGKEMGQTPYDNQNLEPKEYLVKIAQDDQSWEGKVQLTAQTLGVVNREIASDSAFGAGEVLTLDKGKGLTIVSNPSGADIEIDGKAYGTTPKYLEISSGEHNISLAHTNYLKRNIRAKLPDSFNLKIAVDLSLSEADLTTIATPPIKTTPELKVLNTPTGFLNVRDKASTAGKVVAQAKPGDTLVLLEELSGWDRVRTSDNKEGFVSTQYVEKQNP